MLIAAGMKLFGDDPIGWRIAPLLFGAITVTAVWLWTLALTADVALALFAAGITLVDGVIFVQSRIAMLDIFLIAFCVLGLAAFTAGEKRARAGRTPCAGTVSPATASASPGRASGRAGFSPSGSSRSSWSSRCSASGGCGSSNRGPAIFYAPETPGIGALGGAAAYVVAPFLAYFICYAPQLIRAHSLYEFVATHKNMIAIMDRHVVRSPLQVAVVDVARDVAPGLVSVRHPRQGRRRLDRGGPRGRHRRPAQSVRDACGPGGDPLGAHRRRAAPAPGDR